MSTVHELSEAPPGAEIVFPPHGFVHLQAYDASDLDVVNAARVSFNKESEWEPVTMGELHDTEFVTGLNTPDGGIGYGKLSEGDEKVLRFLMKNKHGTPFEHTYMKWHVRAPIFVFREWHRHRIGISINEESARYVPLRPDFYVPEGDALRRQIDKPGRYKFEPMSVDDFSEVQLQMEHAYFNAYQCYENLMDLGLAKEVARTVLPVGIYSQMIWTCNARSLMSFLALRNHDMALLEIREYAAAMERKWAEIMPVTHDSFVNDTERTAP